MAIGQSIYKRVISYLFPLLFIYPCSAQTFLYKRIAIVNEGIKEIATGDAHYITFTSIGCYESDKQGISEDYGFMKHIKDENGLHCYYGKSSFGNAYYYFSSDYNRINIKTKGGITYVYIKTTNKMPLAQMRKKRAEQGSSIYLPTPQVPIQIMTETESKGTQKNTQSRYGYKTCHLCHGSGKCSTCNGTGHTNSYYIGEERICPNCKNNIGKCSVCHGTGKVYGLK